MEFTNSEQNILTTVKKFTAATEKCFGKKIYPDQLQLSEILFDDPKKGRANISLYVKHLVDKGLLRRSRGPGSHRVYFKQ